VTPGASNDDALSGNSKSRHTRTRVRLASRLLNIQSGEAPPRDAFVAVSYKGRWFWISDPDHRSRTMFISVMLLFSVSDVGVRTKPTVVTVPVN
jgi:hypothetical protein